MSRRVRVPGESGDLTGDVPQARASEDTLVIESSSRTHNTFDFVVVAARPGRVLLNSAYDPGWSASVGAVQNHADLLAVDVAAGRSVVHVRYRPRYIALGLTLTLLSALALALYFTRKPVCAMARRLR